MSWKMIEFDAIDSGEGDRIANQAGDILSAIGTPKEIEIWGELDIPARKYRCYFSPAAASVMDRILSKHKVTDCPAPDRSRLTAVIRNTSGRVVD
jgi:hypothetical protein